MTQKESARAFANTITELSLAEVDYSDDFFAKNLKQQVAREAGAAEVLEQYVQGTIEPAHVLSPTATDAHINTDDEHWLPTHIAGTIELAVDVIETEDALIVRAITPGVRSSELDISVQGELLTITGRRSGVAEDFPSDHYLIRECALGDFSRSIIMPQDILHDRVTASLDQGLLTVVLPKSQARRHAKIEVIDVSGT